MQITTKLLSQVSAHSILAVGIARNLPDMETVPGYEKDRLILWVAKKGGVEDWVIYARWQDEHNNKAPFVAIQETISKGTKIRDKQTIEQLTPCSPAVLKLYRK